MPVTRPLIPADAPVLAQLLRANAAFLAPWQPSREAAYVTDEGQRAAVQAALTHHESGHSVPLVILDEQGLVVGTITLQSIIRGFFQSCSVGYWLAEGAQGRGLATQALQEATALAFTDLGLHRVQAETLLHNARSQAVLARLGFLQYGVAPSYMKIAGTWQDNALYQLLTPVAERVTAGYRPG